MELSNIKKSLVVITEALTLLSITDSLRQNAYLSAIALLFTFGVIFYFIVIYYYFGKNHPFYNISIKHSIKIKDQTGKLVEYRNDRTFKPNYPYISRMTRPIISDGTVKNFFATISDSHISCICRIFPYHEKRKLWEISFSEYLKKNKEYRMFSGCDFINSYTQNREYHIFHVEMIDEIYSFSVIFPQERFPKSIKCFYIKGASSISKELSSPVIISLQDGYTEYNWVSKRPQIGNTYKVKWEW